MVPSYSVTPELADLDADGDLDLVVGTRTGAVHLIENVGTRQAPIWAESFTKLKTTSGEVIEGSNAHHADWDGDGVRDLVVGSERGPVTWYRNVGANDKPRYEQGGELTQRASSGRQQEGSTPTGPGGRTKVHVTDWNGDGRADLLVGDVTWQSAVPTPLTTQEKAEKAKLEPSYQDLKSRVSQNTTEWRRLRESNKPVPAEFQKKREALLDEMSAYAKKMRKFERKKTYTHGWVWLYLRKDGLRVGERADASAKKAKGDRGRR